MHPTHKRSHRRRRRWLVLLIAVLAVVAAGWAISLYRPFATSAGNPPPGAGGSNESETPLESLPGERQTFLVMGVEGWEGEYGRSDSMMVVSYDPVEQQLAMLSIPRDVWTLIPGHGYDKINHAYAYGGHTLAVEAVERFLGIDIDHWVAISFDGFVEVIDALGGVELDPPEPLYYVDPYDTRFGPNGLVIDIEAGPQVMDGLTALKYSRFRADAEGDLGRIRRQQEVIRAAIKKAASPAFITRAPQLIPALYSTIGTDMTVGEMVKLAAAGRQALSNPMVTGTIEADPYMIDGIFYFGADLVAARSAAYELLVGEPPGEEFLEQARRDNDEYQSILAQEVARSEAAAAAAAEEAEAGDGANPDGDPGAETDPEGEQGTEPGSAGDPGGDEEPGDGQEPSGDAGPPGEPGEGPSEPVTVNLVDATGQGIAEAYVADLEALGFRVEQIVESQVILGSTMAVARVEGLDVSAELQTLFPSLVYVVSPDGSAEQSIDLVLGTNLLIEQ